MRHSLHGLLSLLDCVRGPIFQLEWAWLLHHLHMMRAFASRNLKVAVLAALCCCGNGSTVAQEQHYKVFHSRTGWTVRYPSSWTTASCRSCPDPHESGVFVDFFPPHIHTADGWIMIEPLADKPQEVDVATWLADVAANANQNTHELDMHVVVDGQPALRVQYRTPQGQAMEEIYVVAGQKTLSIGFSGDRPHVAIQSLPNYQVFSDVVRSFRFEVVTTPKHVRP